ncbi:MAG: hypothetical protein IPL32_09740 [Chloracidobacterium sp.]|nr:hypothetical protein [Chloracidobacterium sp.]
MVISLILLALLALSGLALTYLVVKDESFMWRLSAGSIAGSTMYGVVVFAVCYVAGVFTPVTLLVALAISLLPLLLLWKRPDIQKQFLHDWAVAKGKTQGWNLKKLITLSYYLFFFTVIFFFFAQACYYIPEGGKVAAGITTGGYQNLGDLSFHLGGIFAFSEGAVFPPQNPSYAGAKFSYPFMADMLAACFVKLGADFKEVILVQNVTWAIALMLILKRFTEKITGSLLAGRIAPAILFFSGGLGFIWFFQDLGAATKGFSDFIWNLPIDYTIRNDAKALFRWGNTMTVLFITQRGILFGMPLTILVLQYFWRIFSREEGTEVETASAAALKPSFFGKFPLGPFLVGLMAGTLILVHLHSLAALFIVSAFLFFLKLDKWTAWISFGVGTALIAVPELVWSITGTATDTEKFFGWHFGWDKRENDFLWFWLKNTGLTIPALFVGLYLLWKQWKDANPDLDDDDADEHESEEPAPKKVKKQKQKPDNKPVLDIPNGRVLLYFYLPFAFLFILTNVVKLAPWEWDNIKVLIYWFVGSIPLIAYAVAWLWMQRGNFWKGVAALCLVVLTFAGAVDVWRVASSQLKLGVFNNDSMKLANAIKQKTQPGALILNGGIYNSTVVLSGRQSLMRYPGHLGSYGINYGERENDVKKIYQGLPEADSLLQKHNIEYVVTTPEEEYYLSQSNLKLNYEYFSKFPVIAEFGKYKFYKVKG